MTPVTVARIYLSEGEHLLAKVLEALQEDEQVAGVTAFRGIAGFGRSGKLHTAYLLDMSLDLPLVVEFFDRPEKVQAVLHRLESLISPGHVLTWSAETNLDMD
jgi:PII-like signaling protein